MSNFHLPNYTARLTKSLRRQLQSLTNIIRLAQFLVGAILPVFEGIIINKATDATNVASKSFWVGLVFVAIIHLILLGIIIKGEVPLVSEFLIDYNQQKEKLLEAHEYQSQQEIFISTLRRAIIAANLNLIAVETMLNQTPISLDKIFNTIVDPWIKGRSDIFWFNEGDALYNFAIYLWDKNQQKLIVEFRKHDDRLISKNRKWNLGEGNIGACFGGNQTKFSDNASISQPVYPKNSRPEDGNYYKSVVAEPIRINSKPVGVFIITSSKEQQFQEALHVPIVQMITHSLGIVLNKSGIV